MVLGGVYVCVLPGHVLDTCCVVLLHSVSVCKHVCAAAIAKVLIAKVGGGGLCTFHFGVLAAF